MGGKLGICMAALLIRNEEIPDQDQIPGQELRARSSMFRELGPVKVSIRLAEDSRVAYK